MFYVSLPDAPSEVPDGVSGLHHLVLQKTTTVAGLQAIADSVSAIVAVLAGNNTPAEFRDMAASVWPDATVYRYLGERQWSCDGEPRVVVAATADDCTDHSVLDVSADAAALTAARAQAKEHVSPQWTVLIDESGTHLGAEVDQLGDADKDVGRMVALLLPQDCRLSALKPGFHAVNEPTATIERVLADG